MAFDVCHVTIWLSRIFKLTREGPSHTIKDGRLWSVPAPTPIPTPDQHLDSDSDSDSSWQKIDDSDSGSDSSCQKIDDSDSDYDSSYFDPDSDSGSDSSCDSSWIPLNTFANKFDSGSDSRLQANGLTPTPVPTPIIMKCLTPIPTPVIKKFLTPVPTLTPNCQKTESTPGMTPTPESESPIFAYNILISCGYSLSYSHSGVSWRP